MNPGQLNSSHATPLVEMLRFVDVLASVAEQVQLAPVAHALRELWQASAAGKLRPEELPNRIHSVAAPSVHALQNQLRQSVAVARARAEQRHAEYRRAESALRAKGRSAGQRATHVTPASATSQDETLRAELHRLCESSNRDFQRLAALEDCVAEVEWCRQGLHSAFEAWRAGGPVATAPFPIRPFHARQEFQRWVESLGALFAAFGKVFPEHGRRLGEVHQRLRSPVATITFGGRFNAGKSSVINAALGRPLFPTKDLAETGANCHITAGSRDSAELVCGDERRPLSCDAESLRAAISLRGGSAGTERATAVRRVDVHVAGFPGGEAARWIDPPGMFDRPEMTERAWDAARQADVLVWIFRSQQFLGEAEAEAIATHIATRGSGAVVFVENAFLPRDVPDPWTYHLAEIVPVDRAKLAHLAAELGLSRGETLPLTVVSAEMVLKHGYGFGAGELRRLLGRLAGPDCPWIRRARLQWAERELLLAAESVRVEWGRVNAENDVRQIERDKYEAREKNEQERFSTEVGDALARFLADFHSAALLAGMEVAASVQDLKRDDTYERCLNAALTAGVEPLLEAFCDTVNQIAARRHRQPLTAAARRRLETLLGPANAEVKVENHEMSGGAVVAGAATGAAVGSVVPLIGTFFGGLLGAGVAAFGSSQAALEKDRTDTMTNIRAAAGQVAAQMRDRVSQTMHQILTDCPSTLAASAPAPVERRYEEQLLELSQQLDAAHRAVVEAIRHEASA